MSDIPSIVVFSTAIADAEAPPPLPGGKYRATVETAEVKASQKGNKYAAVMWRISPDAYPADFDATSYPEGMKVPYNSVQMEDTPVNRFRLRRFCEAIGAPAPREIDVTAWIGLEAELELAIGEWEGVPRNEIKSVKRL